MRFPDAIKNLIGIRVECNDELADHPTIQCGRIGSTPTVGPLGLINGIVGIDERGCGYVAAVYNLKCCDHGEDIEQNEGLMINEVCEVEECVQHLELGSLVKFIVNSDD